MTDANRSPIVIDISDDDEPNVGSTGEPSSSQPHPPTSTTPAIEDSEAQVDKKDTEIIMVSDDDDELEQDTSKAMDRADSIPFVVISDDDEPNVGSTGEPSSSKPIPPTSTTPALVDAETKVDEADKEILVDSEEDDEQIVGSTGEPLSSKPHPPTSTTPAIEDAETKMDEADKATNQIMVDREDDEDGDALEPNPSQNMPRTVSKPFVYGSVSRALTRALPNGHTHEWTVYLRPRHNEDMSLYVRRVDFRVYSIPLIRVCTKPPYEMTEVTGGGEFEVQIKLFFVDTSLPPVSLVLPVKLTKCDQSPEVASLQILPRIPLKEISDNTDQSSRFGYCRPSSSSAGKNVPAPPAREPPTISERYDELVFANPSDTLHSNLISAWACTRPDWKPPKIDWDEVELKQVDAIQSARLLVQQEIDKMKKKLADMKEQCNVLEQKVKRTNEEEGNVEDLKIKDLNEKDFEVKDLEVEDLKAKDLEVEDLGDDIVVANGPDARSIATVDAKSEVTKEMGSGGGDL